MFENAATDRGAGDTVLLALVQEFTRLPAQIEQAFGPDGNIPDEISRRLFGRADVLLAEIKQTPATTRTGLRAKGQAIDTENYLWEGCSMDPGLRDSLIQDLMLAVAA